MRLSERSLRQRSSCSLLSSCVNPPSSTVDRRSLMFAPDRSRSARRMFRYKSVRSAHRSQFTATAWHWHCHWHWQLVIGAKIMSHRVQHCAPFYWTNSGRLDSHVVSCYEQFYWCQQAMSIAENTNWAAVHSRTTAAAEISEPAYWQDLHSWLLLALLPLLPSIEHSIPPTNKWHDRDIQLNSKFYLFFSSTRV